MPGAIRVDVGELKSGGKQQQYGADADEQDSPAPSEFSGFSQTAHTFSKYISKNLKGTLALATSSYRRGCFFAFT
jgi:hypothetical protein